MRQSQPWVKRKEGERRQKNIYTHMYSIYHTYIPVSIQIHMYVQYVHI